MATDPIFFSKLQTYATPNARIAAIGVEIPANAVSNEALAQQVQAPEELRNKLPGLIYRTTGIEYRTYAPAHTTPSELAVSAVSDMLARTDTDLAEVDTLIFASTDMDMMEPATANILQRQLGLQMVNAFDVSNACNSFLQAMNVGNSLIATGAARKVLICSGEMGSAVANKELADVDELRVKLGGLTIGDAGAAMLLEPSTDARGLLEINLLSLGEHWQLCHVPERVDWRRHGGAVNPWFYLDMPELAKVARHYTVQYMKAYDDVRAVAADTRVLSDTFDFFIPHQISRRMIEQVCLESLGMAPEKVVITAHRYGNTASTAIPLALRWLIDQGQLELGSGQECFLYGAASGFGIGHIRVRV
jgi:3-oxoacyl-(acyl-carrier-protein) synthase III